MKYKIYKVSLENPDPVLEEMNGFISTHAIESIDKHFVADANNSFWTFCIKYLNTTGKTKKESNYYANHKAKIDYQTYFEDPEDFMLFDELRQLRNGISKQDGVPAYSIFTNAQLAEMIDQKITTKGELEALDGIGEIKLEKYGDRVVELINAVNQRLSKLPK